MPTRRRSPDRLGTRVFLALFAASLLFAAPGKGGTPLTAGLTLEYRLESLSDGKRSEETFRLCALESLGEDRWLLELDLGGRSHLYRAVYHGGGQGLHFAPQRFTETEVWQDEAWLRLDPADLEILTTLADLEARLAGRNWEAESTCVVQGSELPCRRYSFADSMKTEQQGETVTLLHEQWMRCTFWVSDDLPLAGWAFVQEERKGRKTSVFAGKRFAGETETTQETWTLVQLQND